MSALSSRKSSNLCRGLWGPGASRRSAGTLGRQDEAGTKKAWKFCYLAREDSAEHEQCEGVVWKELRTSGTRWSAWCLLPGRKAASSSRCLQGRLLPFCSVRPTLRVVFRLAGRHSRQWYSVVAYVRLARVEKVFLE